MGNLRCVLLLLVALQVTIHSTSALLTKDDVSKCINTTKQILLHQQNSTRTRFDELKKRKLDDAQSYQEKKAVSLYIAIRKERSVLKTFRQSAIDDSYDVSACNDSTAIYDLIEKSFNESVKVFAAEFKSELSRNYTQNLFLVNQFALNYVQLQKKLEKCGKDETLCFEKVQEECEKISIQDDMENLESKFSMSSEYIYSKFVPKINDIYQEKTKEFTSHSENLKECYKTTKKSDGNDNNGDKKSSGISINPMQVLMILSLFVSVRA